MPRPDNETEYLQSVIRRWFNREVRDYFSDLEIDETWDPDLTSSRPALAAACQHQDSDTLALTQLRCWFFEEIRSQPYKIPFYGIPVASFQESRKFQPQISLFFQEDNEDVEPGFTPVTGEISFRLMRHSGSTLNPTVAQQYANRIKLAFGAGGGYLWRKGKGMASYSDWANGYQLQLLVRSKTEARELIERVLDINQDSPQWKKMNWSENEEAASAYPTLPDRDLVYGESRRQPRARPIATVRFRSAFLHIHGLPNPIVLVDSTGYHSIALERV
ncbi:MAG: hypothetical protein ICV77_09770 [Cyanobacteria bacterium Co-bin8]|nr:hypothetical protein [Cyanobacteria bacterium Co-bin8]